MSTTEQTKTEFDYLLNAFEAASQADHPAEHGYGDKREALFAYVRDLERRAHLSAAPTVQAETAAGGTNLDAMRAALREVDPTSEEAYTDAQIARLVAAVAAPAVAASQQTGWQYRLRRPDGSPSEWSEIRPFPCPYRDGEEWRPGWVHEVREAAAPTAQEGTAGEVSDAEAHAIHSMPYVRSCLLQYAHRSMDAEAAAVVKAIAAQVLSLVASTPVQGARMLTKEEVTQVVMRHWNKNDNFNDDCFDAIQRKFAFVNRIQLAPTNSPLGEGDGGGV